MQFLSSTHVYWNNVCLHYYEGNLYVWYTVHMTLTGEPLSTAVVFSLSVWGEEFLLIKVMYVLCGGYNEGCDAI